MQSTNLYTQLTLYTGYILWYQISRLQSQTECHLGT